MHVKSDIHVLISVGEVDVRQRVDVDSVQADGAIVRASPSRAGTDDLA